MYVVLTKTRMRLQGLFRLQMYQALHRCRFEGPINDQCESTYRYTEPARTNTGTHQCTLLPMHTLT